MFQRIKEGYVNNRIWMQPIIYILISFALSIVTVLIDKRIIAIHNFIPDIFLTSVDLAKEILSTLSGALLTMTTFTFSTIMIVLTTYSSDFTPRVVENFLTDESTTRVLGIFVGGFFYCISSLFFMRNTLDDYLIIAATIAIVYSVLCIFYFISFVYSVSSSIQVSKLINRLYEEASEVIDRTIEFRKQNKVVDKNDMEIYKSKMEIHAKRNGYLEDINFTKISWYIEDMTCKIIVNERIGSFISKEKMLATVYYNESDISTDLKERILSCFSIEEERKIYNDYNFSIQKIIEIALRAISPGINDPNTSVHCIKILGVLISKLSGVDGDFISIQNQDSNSKIIYKDIDLKSDIYFTFYQLVHYGREDISVVIALFEAVEIISRKTDSKNMNLVKELSGYIYDITIDNFKNKIDIEILNTKNHAIQNM